LNERKSRSRQPRLAADVRRNQLIRATITSIARHGIGGTTMSTVTEIGGLSVGLVNFYFKNKETLLAETLRTLAGDVRRRWADLYALPDVAPHEKLRSIIEALFSAENCSRDRLAVWFAFFGDEQYRALYRSIIDAMDTERATAIAKLCAEIRKLGDYGDVDPRALTQSIDAMVDGLWLHLLLYTNWVTAEEARQRLIDLLALHFPQHFARAGSAARRKRRRTH
jgi:TetR/AcrR family transcriptional repressor of bet genes